MQTTLSADTLRVTFDGDLLSTNVDALRTEILDALTRNPAAQTIIADLSHSRLVDSKGVNLLIALFRETQRRKLAFRVENPLPEVRRLLALLNLNERFGLTASA